MGQKKIVFEKEVDYLEINKEENNCSNHKKYKKEMNAIFLDYFKKRQNYYKAKKIKTPI